MNTKLLLATAVALSLTGGLVMADEVSPLLTSTVVAAVNPVNTERNLLLQRSSEAGSTNAIVKPGSVLSRAQLSAQVAAAHANGTLLMSDADYYWKIPAAPSTLTRASVKANLAHAITNGALLHNDSDYVDAKAATSVGHMDHARTL